MYQGNAYTQHCPESGSVEARFRAGLGSNRKSKLTPIPADLSRYCWGTVIQPNEITIEQFNQYLSDRFNHYHSVGGILSLDCWLNQDQE